MTGAKRNAKTIADRYARTHTTAQLPIVDSLAHFSHGADILTQIEKERKTNYTYNFFFVFLFASEKARAEKLT